MKSGFLLRFCFFLLVTQIALAADNAKDLEDHFRLYLIKSDKRSQGDRASINGDKGVLYYWKSLNVRRPDEVICDAYEWLLLGRTSYGKGIDEAFKKFPSLNQIDLSFYDMEFSTKKGLKRAEILPAHNVVEYLRIGIRRDTFAKKNFNRKDVKQMIEKHECVEVGKNFIDSVSINESYIKGKQK